MRMLLTGVVLLVVTGTAWAQSASAVDHREWTDLERYATIATAIFAAWSAYESRRAASSARAAAEGRLLSDFLGEYFDPTMNDALMTMRKWNDVHGSGHVERFIAGRQSGDEAVMKVDAARRRVKSYFEKCVSLLDANLVRRPTFQAMAYTSGVNLYYDIICPIEAALDPQKHQRTLEVLKQHVGRYQGLRVPGRRRLPLN